MANQDDIVMGSLIEEYRNKLDSINPYDWAWENDVNLAANKIMIKANHISELRIRSSYFASKPLTGYSSGCNASCAGLCQGCGSGCDGACNTGCSASCSGSCTGSCSDGCTSCDMRWF